MKKIFISGSALLLPGLAFAQQSAQGILGVVGFLLSTLIPILITLAIVYFIWGLLSYITAKDDDKKAKGKSVLVSGIIALFVMLSIWGIIGVIQNTLQIGGGGTVGANLMPNVENVGSGL